MRRLLFVLLLLSCLSLPAATPGSILYFLTDASASMQGQLPDQTMKMDAVKVAVMRLLANGLDGYDLSFRTYGQDQQCGKTDLFLDFMPASEARAPFMEKVMPLMGSGQASLTDGLIASAKDIRDRHGAFVIITDGWDDCNKDPMPVLQKFLALNPVLKVWVIGLRPDYRSEESLRKLAELPGVNYLHVEGVDSLTDVLKGITKAVPAVNWVSGKPSITFSETYYDFGKIDEGKGKAIHPFTFINNGSKPLQVEAVRSSCGCTVGEWTQDSIWPGEAGVIKVVFDPVNRPGIFTKTVTVFTTVDDDPVVLKVSGEVLPREKGPEELFPFEEGNFRFRTNHLTFGEIKNTAWDTMTTYIYNQSDHPIKFTAPPLGVPDHLKLKVSSMVIPPKGTIQIAARYDATVIGTPGFRIDEIVLQTNDPQKPVKKMYFSAEVVEDFDAEGYDKAHAPVASISKTSHNWGTVKQGETATAEFEIKNTGKSDLIIRRIESPCLCLKADIQDEIIPPGESGTFILEFNTYGRVGKQKKNVVIYVNDHRRPKIELWVEAVIKNN